MSIIIHGAYGRFEHLRLHTYSNSPAGVSRLSATPASNGALLNFDDAVRATSYEYSVNGGSWMILPIDRIIPGLSPTTAYACRLRPKNSVGVGPIASTSFTTKADIYARLVRPAWLTTEFVLQDNGRTIVTDGQFQSGIKCDTTHTTQNVYMEATVPTFATIGIARPNYLERGGSLPGTYNSSTPIADGPGPSVGYNSGFGIYPGAFIASNGQASSSKAAPQWSNRIVMMAWKGSEGVVHFGVDGVWYMNGPGLVMSSYNMAGGEVMMIAGCSSTTGKSPIKYNFGQMPFKYGPPAGYTAWIK